jgi:hypothetical protein
VQPLTLLFPVSVNGQRFVVKSVGDQQRKKFFRELFPRDRIFARESGHRAGPGILHRHTPSGFPPSCTDLSLNKYGERAPWISSSRVTPGRNPTASP